MYVCTYIHIYISIYIHIYIYIHLSIYLSIYLSLSIISLSYIYIYIYTHIHTHAPAKQSSANFLLYSSVRHILSTSCLGHGHGYECHSLSNGCSFVRGGWIPPLNELDSHDKNKSRLWVLTVSFQNFMFVFAA